MPIGRPVSPRLGAAAQRARFQAQQSRSFYPPHLPVLSTLMSQKGSHHQTLVSPRLDSSERRRGYERPPGATTSLSSPAQSDGWNTNRCPLGSAALQLHERLHAVVTIAPERRARRQHRTFIERVRSIGR
jgi:hypothetical protein